jgi:hypothetical protein
MFVDHYKIVLENEVNIANAGNNLIHRMKQAFIKYPEEVEWNLKRGYERTPSTASQGNVLEAINITLNLLHLHYIDRDVHRTGKSVFFIPFPRFDIPSFFYSRRSRLTRCLSKETVLSSSRQGMEFLRSKRILQVSRSNA